MARAAVPYGTTLTVSCHYLETHFFQFMTESIGHDQLKRYLGHSAKNRVIFVWGIDRLLEEENQRKLQAIIKMLSSYCTKLVPREKGMIQLRSPAS